MRKVNGSKISICPAQSEEADHKQLPADSDINFSHTLCEGVGLQIDPEFFLSFHLIESTHIFKVASPVARNCLPKLIVHLGCNFVLITPTDFRSLIPVFLTHPVSKMVDGIVVLLGVVIVEVFHFGRDLSLPGSAFVVYPDGGHLLGCDKKRIIHRTTM